MRELRDITESEAMEIAQILLGFNFSTWKRGVWEVVDFKALGIESPGVRVMNKKNDYSVDFNFDMDDIDVNNDTQDDIVAKGAEIWFKVVSRLNKMGIFHKWQPEYENNTEILTTAKLTVQI